MTISEFKKIARLLKVVYAELEQEAIKQGLSLLSPEYETAIENARLKVLENHGFTLDEYRQVKTEVQGINPTSTLERADEAHTKIANLAKSIPTLDQIKEIAETVAHEVAQKYVTEPKITNQVVKEVIKPTIVKETVTKVVNVPFDPTPLTDKLNDLNSAIVETRKAIPTVPEMPNMEDVKKELIGHQVQSLKESIEVLGMPDFRKLAMGLDARIDVLERDTSTGGGTWGSITGTLSNQTDLQSALDAKITATSTNTLTNKRITKRSGGTTSSATPTINTDLYDQYGLTALATDITSFTTNLSGTPASGDTLWIAITDDGTARAITWGLGFESSGNALLPVTTVAGVRMDIGFRWNNVTGRWRCQGVA